MLQPHHDFLHSPVPVVKRSFVPRLVLKERSEILSEAVRIIVARHCGSLRCHSRRLPKRLANGCGIGTWRLKAPWM